MRRSPDDGDRVGVAKVVDGFRDALRSRYSPGSLVRTPPAGGNYFILTNFTGGMTGPSPGTAWTPFRVAGDRTGGET